MVVVRGIHRLQWRDNSDGYCGRLLRSVGPDEITASGLLYFSNLR